MAAPSSVIPTDGGTEPALGKHHGTLVATGLSLRNPPRWTPVTDRDSSLSQAPMTGLLSTDHVLISRPLAVELGHERV